MDSGLWWLLVAVAAVALAGALAAVASSRGRRRLEAELAASRAELAALHDRLDGLTRSLPPPSAPVRSEPQEFVITTAGTSDLPEPSPAQGPAAPPARVDARTFASVAAGESLVTLVSLGHGLRRALSAENRNRIAFEMRREVRRSRQQRKRDLKKAKRHLRARTLREDAA